MKFSIIFLAAAALISGQAGAESKKPAPGAGYFVYGAQAGSGGVQIPVQTRASTKTADGRLDEYIVFQYDQDNILLLSQSRYSASGVLVERVEFTYESGRVARKVTRDEQGQPHSMISYQYNPQGLITKETLSDRNGRALSSYEYQYDGNGNRVIRIINNTQGGRIAETSFVYRNGLLVSSETRDGTGRKTGSSENTYDSQGNRVTERVFDARGDVVRIVNETWRNGLGITLERTNGGGRVLLRETYEYGAHDELVRKSVEDMQSGAKKLVEYEYAFREEQRP
ncbi:MAG: hypothetical protein LBI85_00890 [Spirochaetaceae bacterium]|nr:hypothetical protein [Spirochaetaceae bacterium]